jgi:hypothetical protein
MPDDIKTVTLSTLANGAAEELFAEALKVLLKNVQDPNTDFKAKRSIILSCTFHVDENRRTGEVHVGVATKLAGIKGAVTNVYYGRHHGVESMVEAPTQETLFKEPDPTLRAVRAEESKA